MAFSLIMELYKKLGRAKLQPFLDELRPAQQEALEDGFLQASGKSKPRPSDSAKANPTVEIVTHISPSGASPKPGKGAGGPSKS